MEANEKKLKETIKFLKEKADKAPNEKIKKAIQQKIANLDKEILK